MTWTADGYWAKAQTYFRRAFMTSDATEQGLWASLGIELLMRSAICQTHPALNADPKDDDGLSILAACGVPTGAAKTIPIKAVLRRLGKIHATQMTKRRLEFLEAFTFKRNEEVHADTAAFIGYEAARWLPGFADSVIATCEAIGRPLGDLVEPHLVPTLEGHARSLHDRVRGLARQAVDHAKTAFEALPQDEQERLRTEGTRRVTETAGRDRAQLGTLRCPACGAVAAVAGRAVRVGEPRVEDGSVAVDRWLVAEYLKCFSCSLELENMESILGSDLDPHFKTTAVMGLDDFLSLEEWDGYENM